MDLITAATAHHSSVQNASIAVLPIGSFEQHGRHLPLATDTIVAATIAASIADRYDLFLLPPITISCSHEHASWKGTVSISSRTLTAIVADIRTSLQHQGIERLVLVNGHGGNYVLSNVVQEASIAGPTMALFPARQDWEQARRDAGLTSNAHDDMHAGEIETSILLHVTPGSVADNYASDDHLADRPHMLTHGLRRYTDSGVIGQPSLATAEKGDAVIESLGRSFATTLNSLMASSLPTDPGR